MYPSYTIKLLRQFLKQELFSTNFYVILNIHTRLLPFFGTVVEKPLLNAILSISYQFIIL